MSAVMSISGTASIDALKSLSWPSMLIQAFGFCELKLRLVGAAGPL
jgi:hypothetical protein